MYKSFEEYVSALGKRAGKETYRSSHMIDQALFWEHRRDSVFEFFRGDNSKKLSHDQHIKMIRYVATLVVSRRWLIPSAEELTKFKEIIGPQDWKEMQDFLKFSGRPLQDWLAHVQKK